MKGLQDLRHRASATTTYPEVIEGRAARTPDERAYVVLIDGDEREHVLTWAGLDAEARRVAVALQRVAVPGDRVLILCPTGADFLRAFFGTLYAGMAAVPMVPPHPAQFEASLEHLRIITLDSGARTVLTSRALIAAGEPHVAGDPVLRAARWVAVDAIEADVGDLYRRPAFDAGALALLQYTSGSTGRPKGVVVSQRQLLANNDVTYDAFEMSDATRLTSWLPMYHDMGLIGFTLVPIVGGFPLVMFSPLQFLQRPLRWLAAVSRYRATLSGGPNFAYDLCARRISPADCAQIDLSSWVTALNGAEPVRAETLDRFAAAFAPFGFRRSAFQPCYGLAEATLLVAGRKSRPEPLVCWFDGAALAQNEAREVERDRAGAVSLVSSGEVVGFDAIVVDPETSVERPAGHVGEIWLRGPSVADGYFGRPEETMETFRASLASASPLEPARRFLRTGDLAFIHRGELFIVGRHKDLIIVGGKNHYPQDIELSVERVPSVRAGGVAAFSVDRDGVERVVIVAEVERRFLGDRRRARTASPAGPEARERGPDRRVAPEVEVERAPAAFSEAEVIRAVRGAVSERHGLSVEEVVLIKPGLLPKTSSGKVRRRTVRAAYLDGSIATWRV